MRKSVTIGLYTCKIRTQPKGYCGGILCLLILAKICHVFYLCLAKTGLRLLRTLLELIDNFIKL